MPWVKPRVYQVNLHQISEKKKNYLKENSELAKKISVYEQKINEAKKSAQENKRQNKILGDEAHKLEKNIKMLGSINDMIESISAELASDRDRNRENQDLSGDVSGGFKDSKQTALTSNKCNLEVCKSPGTQLRPAGSSGVTFAD
ncbi:transport and Golgi organization protein 1 homolog [Diceros bicornis minor]|uniref:transport and Golgi organization protein 1 homolog n=1 Tax=Diceros bicornis minor TaxID=77932 RepID=UPI0026EF1377|nr:transport and Golgi organization protein 1 homolog [Diceros bicornis minor]